MRAKLKEREKTMSTFTIQIPVEQASWFEQMIQTMGWVFSRKETSVDASNDEQQITPALRKQINRARKEYADGQTITCWTPQEMQQYFDSL